MFSEIIWSLIGLVWLVISIYIAYLIFKFGKPLFQKLLGFNGLVDLNNINQILKQYNHNNKNR